MKAPKANQRHRYGPQLASLLLQSIGLGHINAGPLVKPMVDPMLGFKPRSTTLNTAREQARRLRQKARGTHGL